MAGKRQQIHRAHYYSLKQFYNFDELQNLTTYLLKIILNITKYL